MAFLMLLHEKMRLQRKISRLTLRQVQASSRKERVTKQIERVQKMYSSRTAKVQKMAQMMQSQFNVWAQNMSGLGAGSLNPMNFGAAGGISNFQRQGISKWAQDALGYKDKNDINLFSGDAEIQALINAQMSGGLKTKYKKDDSGNLTQEIDKEHPYTDGTNDFTADQVAAFNAGMQQIQQMESMQRMQLSQMSQQYQNNISIWLEANEAQIEAEQDAALAPLQEQETEWDLESTSAETQLADARAILDSVKQALQDGIKDSAPTFGLG